MKQAKGVVYVVIVLALLVPMAGAQATETFAVNPEKAAYSADLDIQYNSLYAPANDQLWQIDPDTNAATLVGYIGLTVTDAAFFLGSLYGITFSQLIAIDPTTGAGTLIGNMGYYDVNGLTISRDGTGYATTISGNLLKVNIATGQASLIGAMGSGYHSSGDVAISDDDHIYAALDRDGYYNTWLVYLNRENGAATPIGDIGYSRVWGISFKDDVLYGVTYYGEVLTIDPDTGQGTLLFDNNAYYYGLATSGPSIIGSIITPPDNYTTGPASVQFEAVADYPGGPGIAQVEFYAYSDVEWRSYGDDETSPYGVIWTPPAELKTQQVLLRIDVVGLDLERVNYAGGVRRLNYEQSWGNPDLVENWVGNRAYLNQLSLGDNGWEMCSATSMAMVLAIEGSIDNDYLSMANKAIEMFPEVLDQGTAYVYLIASELRDQGLDAVYFGSINVETGWDYLKDYIDAGHSVIIRTEQGVLTSAGHYIVAVGYQEEHDNHTLIAYDPYGMWRGYTCEELGTAGCINNYFTNKDDDPTSHVGQWVFYDFDEVFGNYLIAPAAHTSAMTFGVQIPSSPPDSISDEPRVIGTNSGIVYGDKTNIFIPYLNR